MHFHKAVFAVAVSVLFGSGGAAPSASPSNSKSQNIKSLEHMAASGEVIKLADVVRFLEDEGKLEWTQTRNGSRMTSIPQSYYNGTLTQMRKGTHSRLRKRGWGDWSSAGTIAGLAAQYSCYDSGDTGLMGQARGYVNQACDDLTQASAQGRLVNGAWQIWQSAQTSDADGNPSIDLFGVMPWGSNPPQYQSSMCTSALEALTSWACAEGGGDGSDSQGGGVAVGTSSDTDDGAMEFRFDPQSV